MWRSRRADLVPAFATFALCLAVGVELGILAGVTVNLILLLYPSARPQLEAEIVTVCNQSYSRSIVVIIFIPSGKTP